MLNRAATVATKWGLSFLRRYPLLDGIYNLYWAKSFLTTFLKTKSFLNSQIGVVVQWICRISFYIIWAEQVNPVSLSFFHDYVNHYTFTPAARIEISSIWHITDLTPLESVQRLCDKLITGCERMSYDQRVKKPCRPILCERKYVACWLHRILENFQWFVFYYFITFIS